MFPIPFLFISPRKHAILIYSIYRAALGSKDDLHQLATYDEFVSYLFKSNQSNEDLKRFYFFYYNYLKLIKVLTPFRIIFGLETGKKHYKNETIISDDLVNKFVPLLGTPSTLTLTIKKLMNSRGFSISLAFIYKVARLSEFLGKKLKELTVTDDLVLDFNNKLSKFYEWYSEQLHFEQKYQDKIIILSIAHMSERNICIAGIFDNGKWGRLIYNNEKLPIKILQEKGIYFKNFHIRSISILSHKTNLPFTEDYFINWTKKLKVIGRIPIDEREEFLLENCENSIVLNYIQQNDINNIGEVLEKINRSLILIGPLKINCALFKKGIIKKYQARIQYSLINSNFISEDSISCTDKLWRKLGQIILTRYQLNIMIFNENDLKEIFGILKVFMVIGLSREFKGKFWELIVGIHTIPDLELIISKLEQGFYDDNLNKFLKSKKDEFQSYDNTIIINLNQRNFPNLVKKKISRILKDFEDDAPNCLFQLIDYYENELREYIKSKISVQTPKQWYRKYIEVLFSESKIGKIDSKFYKDDTHKLQHIYNHPNPLIYTNLEDLYLIVSSPKNHKLFFNSFTEIIYHYMKKIEDYRNAIMHYRPIQNKEDAVFFIIKMLEFLYST